MNEYNVYFSVWVNKNNVFKKESIATTRDDTTKALFVNFSYYCLAALAPVLTVLAWIQLVASNFRNLVVFAACGQSTCHCPTLEFWKAVLCLHNQPAFLKNLSLNHQFPSLILHTAHHFIGLHLSVGCISQFTVCSGTATSWTDVWYLQQVFGHSYELASYDFQQEEFALELTEPHPVSDTYLEPMTGSRLAMTGSRLAKTAN